MNDDLTILTAGATKRAFEEMAEVWLDSGRQSLLSVLESGIPAVIAEASCAFAAEFAAVFVRSFLHSGDSLRRRVPLTIRGPDFSPRRVALTTGLF